ncbi:MULTISPECIES: putative RiPP precursor [unclassified Mesorhizobium]|nr:MULTISPECIES: putative RiPP precursor [unclassified Mesorhizobium]MBZ9742115.1 putative RiPP precursor [Mesorhizobium sp. CO1-1-4]MBZ9804756.1 putative RiPP precursor [Mesorhizobium sp. ES1-6]
MKKLYERPALVRKGNLKLITAGTNGTVVISKSPS